MRFLCLHGVGSNSRVFEAQTALLRREMEPEHTFEFVEGTIPTSAHASLRSMVATSQEYYGFYGAPDYARTFEESLDNLDRYLAAEGPFDGLMAFSQGSSLASALLLRHEAQNQAQHGSKPLLKCAIFLSGRPPYIDLDRTNPQYGQELRAMSGSVINIPTIHVWGSNDLDEPGFSEALSQYCSEINRTLCIHAGAHEPPGSKDMQGLMGVVHAIKRMARSIERQRKDISDECVQ